MALEAKSRHRRVIGMYSDNGRAPEERCSRRGPHKAGAAHLHEPQQPHTCVRMAPRQMLALLASGMASPPCPGPTRRRGAGHAEAASQTTGTRFVDSGLVTAQSHLVAIISAQDQQEALTYESQHVRIACAGAFALHNLLRRD